VNELPTVVNQKSLEIMCDNQCAIKLLKTTYATKEKKHIDIQHNFVREIIEEGEVTLNYTPTNDMVADIITKGLPR
jgi:hypothetical protein